MRGDLWWRQSIDGTRWHDLWSQGGVTGIMGARRIYGI